MSRLKITKRPATDADKEFARITHHQGYHDAVLKQFGAWDETRQDGFFNDSWDAGKYDILLYDGQPCGYVWVEHHSGHAFVSELVIHPDFQGQGIGSFVLKNIIEDAMARGNHVRLQVLLENPAIIFYLKLGFIELHRTDTHIYMKFEK